MTNSSTQAQAQAKTICALGLAITCLFFSFVPASAQTAPSDSSTPFAAPLQPFKLNYARQVFNQTWQFINSNYVDPNFNGLDWNAMRAQYEPKARSAQTLQEFHRLMIEMVAKLDDGHSVFLPPRQASALQSQRLGSGTASITGLAANLRKMPDRSLLVLQVIPRSQAESVITPGDRILAIEGNALDKADRTDLLFGREGAITLTVQSPDSAPREVLIERETYSTSQIPPPVVARRLAGDVGYLAVYDFLSFTTVFRVREALQRLLQDGPLRGLIVDMRANDGGIIGQMNQLLGLFINGGSAGSHINRNGQAVDYVIPRNVTLRALEGVPVVVLAASNTNSSGDIFTSVMQARGRARVVGVPTPGNVEMLQAVQLPDESVLWVAVRNYRDPNGRLIEGLGVQPDRTVDAPWWQFALDDDPQVKAAIEVLRQ